MELTGHDIIYISMYKGRPGSTLRIYCLNHCKSVFLINWFQASSLMCSCNRLRKRLLNGWMNLGVSSMAEVRLKMKKTNAIGHLGREESLPKLRRWFSFIYYFLNKRRAGNKANIAMPGRVWSLTIGLIYLVGCSMLEQNSTVRWQILTHRISVLLFRSGKNKTSAFCAKDEMVIHMQ